MSKTSFKQILLKVAKPRLETLEYEFDHTLTDRNIAFSFRKHLGYNSQALLTFQRHQHEEIPYGYGFTVELERRIIADTPPGEPTRYEAGSFGTRLPHLITNVYGLRLYPQQDYWWESVTVEKLRESINDAVDKFERYGIPVIEDEQFRSISSGVGLQAWNVFQEILNTVVPEELSALGYQPKDDPVQYWIPTRGKPHRHFVKSLKDDLYSFISFHPLYISGKAHRTHPMTEPEYHHFGVLIARKRSNDPNAEITISSKDCFQGWLGPTSPTLSEVKEIASSSALWEYIEVPGPLATYEAASDTVIWKYSEHVYESLTAQLKKAVEKIKQDGISLLEDIE